MLFALATIVAASSLHAQTSTQAAETRPNIVIIWSDDQNPRTLGVEGNTRIRTPNIDRLAAEGVRFTRYYVPVPVCGPSRAAFLTGRYPFECGIMSNKRGDAPGFDRSLPTFASILRKAGYRCGLVGKWHLGGPEAPQSGFDDFWVTVELDRDGKPAGHYDPDLWIDGQKVRETGYDDDVLTRHAIRFIDQCAERPDAPFLLWVCLRTPHTPYAEPPDPALRHRPEDMTLPESAADDLSQKPLFQRADAPHLAFKRMAEDQLKRSIADHYGMVAGIDASVGQIVQRLADRRLDQNTLVVFASDNGWLLGEHRMYGKAACFYEELVRMPLVMRWPARLEKGKRIDALVSSMDFLPTLAEIAGVRELPDGIDGVSLMPLLDGKTPRLRDHLCLAFDRKEGQKEPRPALAIVGERYKLTTYLQNMDEEFYDLVADPFEMKNAVDAPDLRERVKELRELLVKFNAAIRNEFWNKPPDPPAP